MVIIIIMIFTNDFNDSIHILVLKNDSIIIISTI